MNITKSIKEYNKYYKKFLNKTKIKILGDNYIIDSIEKTDYTFTISLKILATKTIQG